MGGWEGKESRGKKKRRWGWMGREEKRGGCWGEEVGKEKGWNELKPAQPSPARLDGQIK